MAEKNWDCLRLFQTYEGSCLTLLITGFWAHLAEFTQKIELAGESLHELHEVFPDFSWK